MLNGKWRSPREGFLGQLVIHVSDLPTYIRRIVIEGDGPVTTFTKRKKGLLLSDMGMQVSGEGKSTVTLRVCSCVYRCMSAGGGGGVATLCNLLLHKVP